MYIIDYTKMKQAEDISKVANKEHSNVGYAIPDTIAMKMVELIDSSWFIPKSSELNGSKLLLDEYANNHRVLDICCNSGVLLYWFLQQFRKYLERYAKTSFNNSEDELCEYILKNLLYGVSINSAICRIIRSMLYNNRDVYGNIYNCDVLNATHHADSDELEIRGSEVYIYDRNKGEKVPMKFDVVCGNPPYNDDMYLDFVMLGHRLAKTYDLWITPAKWQAKGGQKNDIFRRDIVPYMSDILFYPFVQDIFDIRNVDGLTIYLVNKEIHSVKHITNISKFNQFNNSSFRQLDVLNNILSDLLAKMNIEYFYKVNSIDVRYFGLGSGDVGLKEGEYKILSGGKIVGYCDSAYIHKNISDLNKFKVCLLHMNGNAFMTKDNNTLALNKMYLLNKDEIPVYDYIPIFVSENKSECLSCISYFDTKLIRFILFGSAVGQTCNNLEYWRFVPDPGSFDKVYEDKPLDGYTPDENGIYTDKNGVAHCSLYVKYKLTQQEIDVIESVIRERV